MSGNAFHEDRERCREAGMTAFITKPVMPEDFYLAICGALECAQSPLTKAEMTVLKKSTRFSAWPRTAHNE